MKEETKCCDIEKKGYHTGYHKSVEPKSVAGEGEWEKEFDKLSNGQGLHYTCDGKSCDCDDIVKLFIKELLIRNKLK